ncbi:MAG: carboxymuconolactone decarboxylase family protein [Phycisphaerales bacterium]
MQTQTERGFPVHTIESSPEPSRTHLADARREFGMLANMHAVMSESPALLEAYATLWRLVGQTSLSAAERHVVFLTASVANGCDYCVPAHTALAARDGLDTESIEALRAGRPLADSRLDALRRFTLRMIESRGQIEAADLDALLAEGFTRAAALDVLVGLATKLLSNYTNGVANVPLDEPFGAFAWSGAPALQDA